MPTATYTISDGNGGTDSANLSFADVAPVNDPPVAVDDGPVPVTEDTPATGSVLPNDSDVDGDLLTVTAERRHVHRAAGTVTSPDGL